MRFRALVTLTAAATIVFAVAPAFAQVKGTASYRERIALPPDAVFEATLEDVSKADARAEVIGRARIERPESRRSRSRSTTTPLEDQPARRFTRCGPSAAECCSRRWRFEAVDAALAQPAADSLIVTVEEIVGGAAAGGVISWKGIPYAALSRRQSSLAPPQPVLP
jgi:hypothetical protein